MKDSPGGQSPPQTPGHPAIHPSPRGQSGHTRQRPGCHTEMAMCVWVPSCGLLTAEWYAFGGCVLVVASWDPIVQI